MEFFCQRADKLLFKDESFDIIICKDTFHHFISPVGVLRELFRILKRGGKIYMNDLRRDVNKKIIVEVINKLVDANLANTQQNIASVRASYTIPEMKRLLKKLILKIIK